MKSVLIWMILLILTITRVISSHFNKELQKPIQVKLKKVETEEHLCPLPCDSPIYCHGELLHDVQISRIYQDSKTFVDKKLLYPESEILKKYQEIKKQTEIPSPKQIEKFVNENFVDELLLPWKPPDFRKIPPLVKKIKCKKFKRWIVEVNKIWLKLGVKIPDEVKESPEMNSFIYLPNGFIKAGGRFREMYYWDTYWITRGLLLSGMPSTVKGIINNFIHLIKIYGHVPNGNRKYYIRRSQPPLLIQMAATYHHWCGDDTFIRQILPYLEQEFQWWYSNRTIQIEKDCKTYKLAFYNATSCFPRPESYYEDYALSLNLTSDEEKKKLYTGIHSSAESGWDFSSKHIRNKDGSNQIPTLLDLDPPSIIYVELNSILHANAIALREWYKYFGDEIKAKVYNRIANEFLEAIENVLWNEDVGIWLDYDYKLKKSRNYLYASNLAPLWTFSYRKNGSYVDRVIEYLKKEKMIKSDNTLTYLCFPASKIKTGQQWDFPNCWAPLQAFVTIGLHRTKHPIAQQIALNIVKAWIRTAYEGFYACKFMFEKYSALEVGVTGVGGEYHPQMGFGWTNGFIMEIFDLWGDRLQFDEILAERIQHDNISCPKINP